MAEELRLCDGCLTMRAPHEFIVGMTYCVHCRRPAYLGEQPAQGTGRGTRGMGPGARRTAHGEATMEKRACSKGCGKMLDPRGAAKHERTCAGARPSAPAAPRPGRRAPRMIPAPAAVPVGQPPTPPAAGLGEIRARVLQLATDVEGTLRVLELLAAREAAA